MTPDPSATTATPGRVNPDDVLSLWEFYSDLFVPEMGIMLPLKDAHRDACEVLERIVTGDTVGAIEYAIGRGFDLGPALKGLEAKEMTVAQVAEAIRFVLINIPPRVGKTKLMEALVCWFLGYFTDGKIMYTSYAAPLAVASLAYICKVMRSPWYVDIFGDLIHSYRTDRLATIDGGEVFAEGMGGQLIGKGAGLKRPAGGFIIIDDPAKADETLSPVMSENVRTWFVNTLLDRRNSTEFTPIIVCAQRLAPLDLPGYLLKEFAPQTLRIKCAALVDPKTGKPSQADDAISAFPETITTADLLLYRKTRIGRYVLASKYQQEPTALFGNLIPTDKFRRYNPNDAPQFERTVITVDTAMKIKQHNDNSCAALWGLAGDSVYLIDLVVGKWETPQLISIVSAFWNKTCARNDLPRPRLLIEEKAAGTPLLQSLRALGIPAEGIERDIDKVRRVKSILQWIETGLVSIPQDNSFPWVEGFLTECGEFAEDGTAPHDDQVDTMVDAIEELLGKGVGILEVLKRAMEAQKLKQAVVGGARDAMQEAMARRQPRAIQA